MSLEPSVQDPYADAYLNPPQPPQPSVGESGTKERSPPPPTRGRSRSRSPGRFRSPPRRRSPVPRRPSHAPIPQAPTPSNVLGVFGLSIRTQERDLEDEFNRFGRVEKVTIVYDQRSDRSRGFGFIRMSTVEEATRCIQELNGIDLNGRRIRVDYSVTDRPHAPTPGEYMGHRSSSYRGRDSFRERDRDREHHREHRDSYHRDDNRRGHSSFDRERERDPYGRDREVRDRRTPPFRGRYSPPPSPRRRRSYSRSPPRGSGSSPTKVAYDGGHSNGAPDPNGRW